MKKCDRNLMNRVPPEIFLQILRRLNGKDLRNSVRVDMKWYKTIRDRKPCLRRESVHQLTILDSGDKVTVILLRKGNANSSTASTSYDDLFEHIWSFSPNEIVIHATSNRLRKTLADLPDWWLRSIKKLGIFESRCDVDAGYFLSRLPSCQELVIDPCFTIDNVADIASSMQKIHVLKLLSQRTILADDHTLDLIIEKSQHAEGLRTFWAHQTITRFSMDKVLELLQKTKFADRSSLFLDRVIGEESRLLRFLENETIVQHTSGSTYTFRIRNSDVTLIINNFD